MDSCGVFFTSQNYRHFFLPVSTTAFQQPYDSGALQVGPATWLRRFEPSEKTFTKRRGKRMVDKSSDNDHDLPFMGGFSPSLQESNSMIFPGINLECEEFPAQFL